MIRILGLLFFISFTPGLQNSSPQTGLASYYADKFEGCSTASGELYQARLFTAAHRTFPFGSKAKVTDLANEKSVIVTINDRGPFVKGRIIDLSKAAAEQIDLLHKGVAKVKVELIEAP